MYRQSNSKLGYCGLLRTDLDEVIESNPQDLINLGQKRILVLGGTGFVGKWLIASLMHAQSELKIEYEVTIVTRNVDKSRAHLQISNQAGIEMIEHDLSAGPKINLGKFDILVHGATPSVPSTGSFDEVGTRTASRNATQTVINSSDSDSRILNLSSGAVMGNLRTADGLIQESKGFGNPLNSYASTKIEIEEEIDQYCDASGASVCHARLFAFCGPYISLTDHFAVGNFMNDVLKGKPILVKGNPRTTRSYMYPTDLISSLVRLIHRFDVKHINVGSPKSMSMSEVAKKFSELGGGLPIDFVGVNQPSDSYVPEVSLMKSIQQFDEHVTFESSLSRWKSWLTERN